MTSDWKNPAIDRSLPRLERRKLETRALLVDAVREEIISSGIGHLSNQRVSDRADLAQGTFYNHFDTMAELVSAALAIELAPFNTARTTSDVASIFDAIANDERRRSLFAELLNNHSETRSRLQTIINPMVDKPIVAAALVGALTYALVDRTAPEEVLNLIDRLARDDPEP